VKPIYFVGAGPGDPELITLKGARLLAEADLVLYAGSLVPEAVLAHCRPQARRVSSAGLDLQAQVDLMVEAAGQGRTVVRLHSGDPDLYGAVQEQRQLLARAGLRSETVPGVTAALAAAAALNQELTLPEVSQTVIFTRLSGRTPVPQREALAGLARHRATLCLYLSVGLIEEAAAGLLEGYPPQTPAAVAFRVSWPEQRLIRTSLANLAEAVRAAGIERQAIILVGPALAEGDIEAFSKLYDAEFSHGERQARGDDD